MVVHFPQTMSSARPSSSSLLSSPVRQPTSAPYLAQLQQLNIGLSMVPEVLAPCSRPTSPTAVARIDKLRQQIVHDVFTRKLLIAGNYPRLACSSLRGPFEDSGADWGQARGNPSLAADRQWSPLPADDSAALTQRDDRQKSTSSNGNAFAGPSNSQVLPTALSARSTKESSSRRRSPTHTSNDARSVHTGMVTPPVSSGEDADPIQRSAPRLVSFTVQSQPRFDDLLHVDDDNLFANDEDFAPLATSTQLHQFEGSPTFGEPLLPSPSSPSSSHHAHSSSQPELGWASTSPSPVKRPRLSASQPNASPPRPQIYDMQPATPSKKRRIMEAVELPVTPRTRKTSDLPITPVSVPAHARQPSSVRGVVRDTSPSPAPKSRQYDGIPEFSELVMRSAAKKRRKRPSATATPIAIAVATASGPSQPENRSTTSNNSLSSFPAGFGQQDMDFDFVYTGKLGDIAPTQALAASEGDGLSQPDFAMASSSQSVEIGGAGVSKSVEKRAQRVGRFLQSDAWEF